MSALRKYGLLLSVKGHPKPTLAKLPKDITLFDIYKAVEGEKPLLHLDTHTNPECGIGIHIQLSLQEKAEKEMQQITLQDILNHYQEKIANLNL